MITNGTLLTQELVEGLNDAGLTNLQISVDGVQPNDTTVKTLKPLRKNLELLASHARFKVVMSGVIGSAPPAEALEVVDFARAKGFTPRILLLHDPTGQVRLAPEELAAYEEAKRRIGRGAEEAGDYRGRIIETGEAPFKCRAGARYLYVDEFGQVNWCSQTRGVFVKDLLSYGLADLREQFATGKGCSTSCSVGCVRTSSSFDEWRSQREPADCGFFRRTRLTGLWGARILRGFPRDPAHAVSADPAARAAPSASVQKS